MKSYKDLDIYNLAFEYAIEVHKLSLKLPKFELYEQGSQVRRSSKGVKDAIVEGYGRRVYKQDFLKFLTYSQASLLECTSQLEMISELYQLEGIDELKTKYERLGAKIHSFSQYVEKNWKS
ncbi:four helix bundle protein [Antarcticibacterium flavum]|uniref:Four helix bundle protein n=1 Tax=Antarcticibacterium flavum TaxID=2058175 RepID=A0A5B7X5F0_9FLAO|nr:MULTISPECIES: four helix bundle protein [Antarcticibacterium]MCM4161797.1 four helix bundle protein [Antarcticibacterium sp. W02-3]QCY70607.1 four helix bundle protein [Antarcticibacterium flavum]